ncbi:MAG: TIR domain-containing protein [Nitrosopumilaceae archaeon]|nr:TIR domain-containing protein [Nitrosopumilaceae archaeon]
MAVTRRHKVFVSFHSEDMDYKDKFVNMLGDRIVDRSVGDGDVDKNLNTAEIRRQIRDDFIADATVAVVLVGCCTWQRKYVDWEIGASLTDTAKNHRCGLLGILLPSHPDYGKKNYTQRLMPPRLACNLGGDQSFADLYGWTGDKVALAGWLDRAFRRRNKDPPPDNRYVPFAKNRTTKCSKGWQS